MNTALVLLLTVVPADSGDPSIYDLRAEKARLQQLHRGIVRGEITPNCSISRAKLLAEMREVAVAIRRARTSQRRQAQQFTSLSDVEPMAIENALQEKLRLASEMLEHPTSTRRRSAIRRLEMIVEQWPATEAAKQAQDLLLRSHADHRLLE